MAPASSGGAAGEGWQRPWGRGGPGGAAAVVLAESSSSEAEARPPPTRAAASLPGGRGLRAALALLGTGALLGVAVLHGARGGAPRGGAALRLGERGGGVLLQRSERKATLAGAAAPKSAAATPKAHGAPAAPVALAAAEDPEHLGPWNMPLENLSRTELIDRVKVLQAMQAGHSAALTPPALKGGGAAEEGDDAEASITNMSNCGRKCLVGVLAKALMNKSMSKCASDEQNCIRQRCCDGPGLQCYAKNQTHGRCKADCVPGPDLKDEEGGLWSCSAIGVRAAGQPAQCSKPG
ncbi:unnamed protein product, partial [Prorocentrum cordatum]